MRLSAQNSWWCADVLFVEVVYSMRDSNGNLHRQVGFLLALVITAVMSSKELVVGIHGYRAVSETTWP